MIEPRVSVILPIYNVEDYLYECLESVTRQTLRDIEIICVNDGSTDDSLTIINSFADIDERVIVLDGPNGGYGKAMNRGLDRATGTYVGIVEPDDFVALTMFEDLYKVAVDNDLDFVKADFYRFTRNANGDMKLNYNHLDKTGLGYNEVFDPQQDPERLRYIMNTWSGIYKRSFLEANGIRHNETPGASFQDNGFWFQTFVFGRRAMILDKPYYRNRRDNPNSSVKDTGKVYCMTDEYDYIESIIRSDLILWDRFKYMCWLRRYDNYCATLKRINSAYVPELVCHVREQLLRARMADELIPEVFSEKQWSDINSIIDKPGAFARDCVSQKLKKEAPKKKRGVVRRGLSKAKRTAKKFLE